MSCVEPDEVARQVAAADAERERSLADALRAAKLTPVELELARSYAPEFPDVSTSAEGFFPAWQHVRYQDAEWITGPDERVACGDGDGGNTRFARAADGVIHHLAITPHATREATVRRCGCPDHSGVCGAYSPARVQVRWKLPPGTRYGGQVRVDVHAPVLRVEASDQDPRRCAPPP